MTLTDKIISTVAFYIVATIFFGGSILIAIEHPPIAIVSFVIYTVCKLSEDH